MSVWLCQIAKNQYYAYCRKSMHFTGEEVPKNYESKENMEEDIIKREEHLKECSECRKYMNRMKQELFVREEMGDYLEEEKLLRNSKEVLKKEVKADFMAKVVQFDIPANLMIFIAIFYRNVSFYRIGLCMNIFGWTTEKKGNADPVAWVMSAVSIALKVGISCVWNCRYCNVTYKIIWGTRRGKE